MKRLIIAFFVSFCIIGQLCAQNKLHDRFSFSISGGAAIPVGTFGMIDISNAAIYAPYPQLQNPWIIGIDKSKSGFARIGYNYNAQFRYQINRHIFLLLRAGQTINSVQTSVISGFLTQKYGIQEFEEVDYKIGSVTPGIGYLMRLKQWDISLGLFGGSARSNFPLYKSIFSGTPMIWTLEGEAPNYLFGFSKGSVLSINRRINRISAGIEIMYQHSSFKYNMTTHLSPGSSQVNPAVHDNLIASLLNIGFQLAYTFER